MPRYRVREDELYNGNKIYKVERNYGYNDFRDLAEEFYDLDKALECAKNMMLTEVLKTTYHEVK